MSTTHPGWTADEFKAFEKLVDETSSRNQVTRISARLDMKTFVDTVLPADV